MHNRLDSNFLQELGRDVLPERTPDSPTLSATMSPIPHSEFGFGEEPLFSHLKTMVYNFSRSSVVRAVMRSSDLSGHVLLQHWCVVHWCVLRFGSGVRHPLPRTGSRRRRGTTRCQEQGIIFWFPKSRYEGRNKAPLQSPHEHHIRYGSVVISCFNFSLPKHFFGFSCTRIPTSLLTSPLRLRREPAPLLNRKVILTRSTNGPYFVIACTITSDVTRSPKNDPSHPALPHRI